MSEEKQYVDLGELLLKRETEAWQRGEGRHPYAAPLSEPERLTNRPLTEAERAHSRKSSLQVAEEWERDNGATR